MFGFSELICLWQDDNLLFGWLMEGGNASVIGGIRDETVDLLARFMAGWMVARSRWMSWVDEVDLFRIVLEELG